MKAITSTQKVIVGRLALVQRATRGLEPTVMRIAVTIMQRDPNRSAQMPFTISPRNPLGTIIGRRLTIAWWVETRHAVRACVINRVGRARRRLLGQLVAAIPVHFPMSVIAVQTRRLAVTSSCAPSDRFQCLARR